MSYPIYYVPAGDVLPIMFSSFDGGTGASVTLTGLAVTDIEIYKDGGTTQRASDAGYTLLDTDGIDFDGITGIHGFSIDTGDNTDAGFYAVGAWYHVVVSSVTVDAQTVNFIAAAFRIMAAEGVAGVPDVNTTHISDTAQTGRDIGASVLLSSGTGTGQISLASGAVTVGTNNDKTGYTASTVSDKTGYSLSASQTFNVTGNITGNLSGSVGSVTGAVGSVTGNVGGNVTGSVGSISGVTFPTNFGDMAITVTTGRVTVGTNADKAGYSISGTKTTLDALNDLSAANVNAEVVDAIATDTYAEPGQGTPAATASIKDKIGYLYKFLRNRVTVTNSQISVYNDDAATVDHKSAHSDDETTYDRGEFGSGP